MKSATRKLLAGVVLLCTALPYTFAADEIPLLINCQGRLHDGESLLSGQVKMVLRVYTNATSGDFMYEDIGTVTVVDGIYSTYLGDDTTRGDLLKAMSSGEAYLEITANGTTFMPRERLLTVPYALIAKAVVREGITKDMMSPGAVVGRHLGTGSITSEKLADGSVTAAKLSPEALKALGAAETLWSTRGNKDVEEQLMVLGTLDQTPLDLTAGGKRALRLRPHPDSPNLIGGHSENSINSGASGAAVAGGGSANSPNEVLGDFGFIGGGEGNQAGGAHSIVSGGRENQAFGNRSTIAGGRYNKVSHAGGSIGGGYTNSVLERFGTVPGGYNNTAEGYVSTIGGGWNNLATGSVSVISGGMDNRALSPASSIGGGFQNQTEGYGARVGGGQKNIAAGAYSHVAGGSNNVARGLSSAVLAGSSSKALGDHSIAMGNRAVARHTGSVVISDGQAADFKSTADNQILMRAAGGIGINTDTPSEMLDVAGNIRGETIIATLFEGDGSKLKGVAISGSITPDDLAKNFKLPASSMDASALKLGGVLQGRLGAAQLTPGAVNARSLAEGSVTADAIAPGVITSDMLSSNLQSAISGAGKGAWEIGGTAGLTPGVDYLGTSDNVPLELRVGGSTAMWLIPSDGGAGIALGEKSAGVHKNSLLFSGDAAQPGKTSREGQVVLMAPNNVGINTSTPTEALTVAGSVLADKFIGDGSLLTNIQVFAIGKEVISDASIAKNAAINPDKIAGTALTKTTGFKGDVVGAAENLRIKPGAIKSVNLDQNSVTDAAVAANAKINPTKINGTALTLQSPLGGILQGTAKAAEIRPGTITAEHLAPDVMASMKAAASAVAAPALVAGGALEGPLDNLVLRNASVQAEHIGVGAITDDRLASRYMKALDNGNAQDPTLRMGSEGSTPVEFVSQNKPFMRAEALNDSPNLTLGFGGNAVSTEISGGVVGGGGSPMTPNEVSADYGVVAGGLGNRVAQQSAVVSGGSQNLANGPVSTVSGGSENGAVSQASTVGGGQENTASGSASTIAGGFQNLAAGEYASIPGGIGNKAGGNFSMAAGRNAAAQHSGSFVWADGEEAGFSSTDKNQFLVMASGGFGIGTASPQEALSVAGNIAPDLASRHSLGTVDLPWKHVHAGSIEYRDSFRLQSGGKPALSLDEQANASFAGGVFPAAPNVASLGQANLPWRSVFTSDVSFDDSLSLSSGGAARLTLHSNGDLDVSGFRIAATDESPNLILGHAENQVGETTVGALVMGGGKAGKPNVVNSNYGTVGGGLGNVVAGYNTTIAGGEDNRANGLASTIGGGFTNAVAGKFSTIAGGAMNQALGDFSTVAGGVENLASGVCAAIVGGSENEASGDHSVAMGKGAKAIHNGSFVFADGAGGGIGTSADNQFVARAAGGVFFMTSSENASGVILAPGSGSWANLSDRAVKRDFRAIDGSDVLRRIEQLPIYDYQYKAQSEGIRHIGPTAQDFSAAFGVGEDDRHISSVDADGVALAAIQGLAHELRNRDVRINTLESQIETLNDQLDEVITLLQQTIDKR